MSTPDLALDLRIRYLETLLTRPSTSTNAPTSASNPASLSRRVSQLASSLDLVLEAGPGTDALRKFVANYDLNEPLLTVPPVPYHHPSSSATHDDLTPHSKVSLILEAEYEIRQLEWELRQIALLDDQGVVGAGELAQHQDLRTELAQTKQDVKPLAASYQELEHKTHNLLSRYNDYVRPSAHKLQSRLQANHRATSTAQISTLSEVFVQWNDIVSEAEQEVTRIEKNRNPSLDIS
ncbi:BZ3500_MvSof-1268-A1-R1_Chr4-3g07393 [Microbotryum saponariae]|uniref:BZ3500_MvSof-1268-A1-R1_Chr4-3g07393 protein n=1 Tax=Microbotryum saponariae TaxID=289078 RepID=A0A2X0KYY3_9BASI|nr:BZ3500_MvSof-1268-A1-R1_Chr4-3g07393 [Microbotryum saponariae]SDA07056.1 BZ3501_MvSof-1269-A2-R1_Chr4-2g07102 [Microbotryum saponariae]